MTKKERNQFTGDVIASKCDKHNWYAKFDAECPKCEEEDNSEILSYNKHNMPKDCTVCHGPCRGH